MSRNLPRPFVGIKNLTLLLFLLFCCQLAGAELLVFANSLRPPPARSNSAVASGRKGKVIALTLLAPSFKLNVLDFGAKPGGKIDCTRAFQTAVDAAKKKQLAEVDVPPGTYLIKGTIQIPTGIALMGSWKFNPSHTGIRDKGEALPTADGTTLLLDPKPGAYDPLASEVTGQASINMQSNCTFSGFCLYYPLQKTDQDPVAFPYSVAIRGNNGKVSNVELLNSYDGIDATHCARFLIRNVDGQPIHRGVAVDAIYDIGRIENVHFNPWFSFKTPVFDWEMKHGIAFVFGRSDWQYCTNTFCFGYNVGYQFVKTKNGNCNGNFLGIGADDCTNAVQVQSAAPYGLLITNGEFTSFTGTNPTEVVVSPTNSGAVRFMNCAFWGPSQQIASIDGSGMVAFNGCVFVQWDASNLGLPAIDARSGRVMVTGCNFEGHGAQVKVGPGVKSSVVKDNLGP